MKELSLKGAHEFKAALRAVSARDYLRVAGTCLWFKRVDWYLFPRLPGKSLLVTFRE